MGIFSREKDFFGLDIGSSAIRLVQLKYTGGRYKLISYGGTSIPVGLSQSDSTMDTKQLSEILKRLIKDCKVNTRNVVAALPSSAVFMAVVKIPQMSKAEIGKAIKWQAEQNIPLKIDEVRLDWQLINPSVGDKKEMAVMIVAAPINKVERFIKILEGASLSVASLETISFALSRSLGNTQNAKAMILDIGAMTTEIVIVQNETIFHSRSLPVASFAFTRAISQNLSVDLNQAEQFKRKFGLFKDKFDGGIFKTLEPLLGGITEEVKRSIKFYQDQFGGNIDRVILSGGGARLPELPLHLSNILEMDVKMGNPWIDINYSPSVQQNIIDTSAEYSTAIGLAKRK